MILKEAKLQIDEKTKIVMWKRGEWGLSIQAWECQGNPLYGTDWYLTHFSQPDAPEHESGDMRISLLSKEVRSELIDKGLLKEESITDNELVTRVVAELIG
jgi:hypothetical protein